MWGNSGDESDESDESPKETPTGSDESDKSDESDGTEVETPKKSKNTDEESDESPKETPKESDESDKSNESDESGGTEVETPKYDEDYVMYAVRRSKMYDGTKCCIWKEFNSHEGADKWARELKNRGTVEQAKGVRKRKFLALERNMMCDFRNGRKLPRIEEISVPCTCCIGCIFFL
jgi:hypothetical protein